MAVVKAKCRIILSQWSKVLRSGGVVDNGPAIHRQGGGEASSIIEEKGHHDYPCRYDVCQETPDASRYFGRT